MLCGDVQAADAYLGGELTGRTAGRSAENKVPFICAVAVNANSHPRRTKLIELPGLSRLAIAAWASSELSPASIVISDGLACFRCVTDVRFTHPPIVVGARKPDELPMFHSANTVLGNVKTSRTWPYHSFSFGQGMSNASSGAIVVQTFRR